MSAVNPNPIEKSMVSVLVVANAGGGLPLLCGILVGHGFVVGPVQGHVFQGQFAQLGED
jgi:hypothetical protein